jgi:hypothetical protein
MILYDKRITAECLIKQESNQLKENLNECRKMTNEILIYNENNLNVFKSILFIKLILKPILILPLIAYNFLNCKKCL